MVVNLVRPLRRSGPGLTILSQPGMAGTVILPALNKVMNQVVSKHVTKFLLHPKAFLDLGIVILGINFQLPP